MTLDTTGSLSPFWGLIVAAAFAALTWRLYAKQRRLGLTGRAAWAAPLLRVIVVILLVFMLVGPVLHRRQHIGQPGRVVIFIDASESMDMDDRNMEVERKLLIARQRGWLAPTAVNSGLHDAAVALRDARGLVEDFVSRPTGEVAAVASDFKARLTEAQEILKQLTADAFPAPDAQQTGGILREYWLDIPGGRVSDLTRSRRFNAAPSGSHVADSFEAPADLGDSYGTRLRGYVHPPVTGQYVFWINSDGPSELWLSSDNDPENKRLIAKVSAFTARHQWTQGEHQSQPISLVGDRRYYIEALHKEDTGGDHLAVGWQLPVGVAERPIPGRRLSPYVTLAAGTPQSRRDAMLDGFRRELLTPLDALAAAPAADDAARRRKVSDLAALAATTRRWETNLTMAFRSYARAMAAANDPAMAEALAKVDASPRWRRQQSIVLDSEGLVQKLAGTHDIEIYALREGDADLIWSAAKSNKAPATFDIKPVGERTDLAGGLQKGVGSVNPQGEDSGGQTVAIVLSDGQHNISAANPQLTAALLGDRRIPIYTIGIGSTNLPQDLSLHSVDAPQSVFIEDTITGEILLSDNMPAGRPFHLAIEHKGKPVWHKQLVTDRTGLRRVAYDLTVKDLIDAEVASQPSDVKVSNVPLALKATISPVEGEEEPGNNSSDFTVHGVTEPRRVLLIDGRPRWEARYLRNLFERDARWKINPLLAGASAAGAQWRRGDEIGAFPRDMESLFKYDLIVLGDAPRNLLKDEELRWLRDFVGDRGGGLILIDGQRQYLHDYDNSPLGELFPICWLAMEADAKLEPRHLKLTAAGMTHTALRLLPDTLDNASLWTELPPPHWLAATRALEGAETLAEGVVGDKLYPAMVSRSYGAGRVLYLAFDESWRWRYEVADLYHARFWNQVSRFVGEQPYAVQDQFVKLDAGKPTYAPGEKAEIRARLRDRNGRPMLSADVLAHVYRDGKRIVSIPLEAQDARSGVFRGQTTALGPGKYEVALSVSGLDDNDLKARAKFSVEAPPSLEKREVVMNEETLQQMAQRSRGRYYREEDVASLIKRLEPASEGKIVESEIVLWNSYWWFVPILVLLTIEWVMRKKAGLL